ncbi:MAG: hypothetical protein ACO1OG_04245 [Devosia sp.]
MGVVIIACLLSGSVGLGAGALYSVLGWAVAGALLVVATTIGVAFSGASLLPALGWAVIVILAFNIGLVVGLVLRGSVRARHAADLRRAKTLLNR